MLENKNFPLIIAHRGASATAPENTLGAFRQAIEDGADGLEFDVRLTKDGVPVVFHDPTLKRIAGRHFKIINLTSDELQSVDAGSWFNTRNPQKASANFSLERISTLKDALDFFGDYKGLLYVELKCNDAEMPQLVEAVAKVVRGSKLFQSIIIKSFTLPALEKIKELIPEIRTAALFAPKIMAILRKQSALIEKALEYKSDEISLHFSLASQKIVEKAELNGLQTIIWTADHPVWVKRGAEINLKAVITNNPARLIEERQRIINESFN
jgi:glycerophosphoryl diester phosphodiesterase